MIKRKIFYKRNKYIQYFFYTTSSIIVFLLLLSFFFNKDDYIIIPNYNDSFYIIPDNKGGKEILNQNKQGLHLSYVDNENILIDNNSNLVYSIQILVHDEYSHIIEKKEELTSLDDSIFLFNDIYIAISTNNLGNKYFLLYKNFESRKLAEEYCQKYTFFLEKCLIVNVQNLE